MINFDTEIPNIASLMFLLALMGGLYFIKKYYKQTWETRMLISGIRYLASGVIVGLLWWIISHHGIPGDPPNDSWSHVYKGPMRAVCSALIGFGVWRVGRAYHLPKRWLLFGAIIAYGTAFLVTHYL